MVNIGNIVSIICSSPMQGNQMSKGELFRCEVNQAGEGENVPAKRLHSLVNHNYLGAYMSK